MTSGRTLAGDHDPAVRLREIAIFYEIADRILEIAIKTGVAPTMS
jgi:hypothetical protein